ncbi:MAG: hypothetical protein L3K07_00890, partial [Thermoplasmata archaeon]|nr:hypothetical protein [Thermoplasmata archaeon]
VERWLDRQPTSNPLEETALRLLSRARRSPGWFSAQEAASWVGGRSGPTVLRHLNELVRRGIFEALGQTRAKRYRFVSRASLLPQLVHRASRGDRRASSPRSRVRRSIDEQGPVTRR